MRSIVRAAALGAALLALASITTASESVPFGDCGHEVIDLVGLAYYVVGGNLPNEAWLYLEWNDEPGLQRGSFASPLWYGAEVCEQSPTPDLLVY